MTLVLKIRVEIDPDKNRTKEVEVWCNMPEMSCQNCEFRKHCEGVIQAMRNLHPDKMSINEDIRG